MFLTLRRADSADLPAVVRLMNAAYRGTGANAGWTTEEAYIEGDRTNEALLQSDLAGNLEAFLLVAKQEGDSSLQGCVWLEPLPSGVWYLGSLSVNPALQNSGFGRKLLTAAEQWAQEQGASRIEMHVVNIRHTLIAWYERRGYRLTGETHPFPYGDTRFGTPLRDDLSFVVLEKSLDAASGSDAAADPLSE